MSEMALEAIIRRDRLVVMAALVTVTGVTWAYLVYLGVHMSMPAPPEAGVAVTDMPGMDMSATDTAGTGEVLSPGFRIWSSTEFVFVFTMWAVMMVGMMTPSVAPMVLLYALVGRKARLGGKPFASTGLFFAGYLLVWIVFSIVATGTQWLLTSLALISPMTASASSAIGGVVLVAAGLYQWTPMKGACLLQCQTPVSFLASQGGFRSDPYGAVLLGFKHGIYCLGCCWALMALLFVGGVMNLVWIAGIAILVLLEKIVPAGSFIPRVSGLGLVCAGAWQIVA